MTKTIHFLAGLIAVILIVDVLGFIVWVGSGQVPVGQVYIGTITAHLLRLVIR